MYVSYKRITFEFMRITLDARKVRANDAWIHGNYALIHANYTGCTWVIIELQVISPEFHVAARDLYVVSYQLQMIVSKFTANSENFRYNLLFTCHISAVISVLLFEGVLPLSYIDVNPPLVTILPCKQTP
jgi:hypothetical protein